MSVLPAPVPLDQPPGDPRRVLDVVVDLTAAAGRLEDLAGEVGGALAAVPGWHGADADAAATRAAGVAQVAARTGEGLRTAAARLAEHAECWEGVRRRIHDLRAQQEDDFAVARMRVATPFDPGGWTAAGPVAPLDELAAAERHRQQAFAALVAELADDAAATGRVLAGATAGIDGGAGSGSASHVLVHLARLLPGWAVHELTGRAHEVAGIFRAATTLADWERAAAAAMPYATDPRFAGALLGQLGVDGLEMVLVTVDHADLGADSATALLVAGALAAVGPGRSAARDVVEARYVDPDDRTSRPELIARGMAVLASAGAARGAGIGGPLLSAWARQMISREGAQGPMRDRLATLSPDARSADPLHLVVEALGVSGDAGSAVQVLGDRENWSQLLARGWPDGGAALGDLVRLAGRMPSAEGSATLRAGLEAIGAGLSDGGDPDGWTVDRDVAAAVSPSLGGSLAAHVDVLTEVLWVGVDGRTTPESVAALQGLAYVSLDLDATSAIEAGLDGWQESRPRIVAPVPMESDLPVVAVPSAFLAVREHGQRLHHVLDAHERKAAAERRASIWGATVGLAVDVTFRKLPVAGAAAGALEAVIARALGMGGHWENGPDEGLRFDAAQAADGVVDAAEPVDPAVAESLARHAAEAFERTTEALPELRVPVAPDETWTETAVEGAGVVDVRPRSTRGRPVRPPGVPVGPEVPGE